jgi:hypothetical protein
MIIYISRRKIPPTRVKQPAKIGQFSPSPLGRVGGILLLLSNCSALSASQQTDEQKNFV